MLLLVLMFGAGTDYSLLLVHRYREELGAGGEPLEALRPGDAGERPAIGASAGTVIAAMLVLLRRRPRVDALARPGARDRHRGHADRVASHCCPPCSSRSARGLSGRRRVRPGAAERQRTGAGSPTSSGVVRVRPDGRDRRRAAARRLREPGVDHGTIGFGQGEIEPTDSSDGHARSSTRHFPPGLRVAADRDPRRTRRSTAAVVQALNV